MPVQKYTMEKQLEIGREAYEELIRTKYAPDILPMISEKYGYTESKIKELIRRYRNSVIDPKPTPEQEALFIKYRNEFNKNQVLKGVERAKQDQSKAKPKPNSAYQVINEYLESEDVFPYFIALKYYNTATNFPAALQKMKNGSEQDILYYSAYRAALAKKKQEFSEILLEIVAKLRNGHDINGKHINFEPFDLYEQYHIPFVKFKAYVATLYSTRLKNETPLTVEEYGLLQKFIVRCEMGKSHLTGNLDRVVATKYHCDGRESTSGEVQQILEYLNEKNIPLNSANVNSCFERMCRGLLRRPEKII